MDLNMVKTQHDQSNSEEKPIPGLPNHNSVAKNTDSKAFWPDVNLSTEVRKDHRWNLDFVRAAGNWRLDKCQNLIPGLPDYLVETHIAPKLSWPYDRLMSSVSKDWWKLNRSRKSYLASYKGSTEKLLAILHNSDTKDSAIVRVYNPSINTWLNLPPLSPWIVSGSSLACLRGRILVLGGRNSSKTLLRDVYMLNLLAGTVKWRKCASMIDARADFACSVIQNTLYVAGGTMYLGSVKFESFSFSSNEWKPLANLPFNPRSFPRAATVGNDIYLFEGYNRKECFPPSKHNNFFLRIREPEHPGVVYDTGEERWRELENVKKWIESEYIYEYTVVNGDLYKFGSSLESNKYEFSKFDFASNSWKTFFQSLWTSPQEDGSPVMGTGWILQNEDNIFMHLSIGPIVTIDNDIFAWASSLNGQLLLFKCKNFGRSHLNWEKVQCQALFKNGHWWEHPLPLLCVVDL